VKTVTVYEIDRESGVNLAEPVNVYPCQTRRQAESVALFIADLQGAMGLVALSFHGRNGATGYAVYDGGVLCRRVVIASENDNRR
jgi:hypothetical protein